MEPDVPGGTVLHPCARQSYRGDRGLPYASEVNCKPGQSTGSARFDKCRQVWRYGRGEDDNPMFQLRGICGLILSYIPDTVRLLVAAASRSAETEKDSSMTGIAPPPSAGVRRSILLATSTLAVLCMAGTSPAAPQPFVFSEGGRAKAAVVIPKDADEGTRFTADELVDYLNRITDARFTIATAPCRAGTRSTSAAHTRPTATRSS